jgi:hypothetical protein
MVTQLESATFRHFERQSSMGIRGHAQEADSRYIVRYIAQ